MSWNRRRRKTVTPSTRKEKKKKKIFLRRSSVFILFFLFFRVCRCRPDWLSPGPRTQQQQQRQVSPFSNMSSAVCVCVRVLSRRRKKEPVLLFQWRTWYAQWLWEKHTHTALLLCARSGRESLFSFKGRKKRTKNTWHQTVGARLEGITIRYYLCSLLLPFKTFFFHHSSSLLISTGLTGISFSLLLTVFWRNF